MVYFLNENLLWHFINIVQGSCKREECGACLGNFLKFSVKTCYGYSFEMPC